MDNDQYAYYPGCSLGATAQAYDVSTKAVADLLGLKFAEVDDWNCCGSSEYFSLNSIPAYSLVARNLSLAAQQSSEVVAPCSACFLNLHKTDKYMGKHPELNDKVNRALAAGGLNYDPGSVQVRHLLDMVVEDVGFDAIGEKVAQPLSGIRLAPYYGCLIVRPDSDSGYNPEYPTHLDTLLQVLGAQVVDFPMKAHCCGGHMTQISETVALDMIYRLLKNAAEYEADVIVTLCPMCQLNLDAYQPQVNRMFGTNYNIPVLYFTQMMALAFGLSEKQAGFGTEIVSAKAALAKIGQEVEKPKKERRDKKALPMPTLNE